jgi:hypothetical protein
MPKAEIHTITDRRLADSDAVACDDPAWLWDTFEQANRRNCRAAARMLALDPAHLGSVCQQVMEAQGVAAWFDQISHFDSSIEQLQRITWALIEARRRAVNAAVTRCELDG